MCVLFMCIMHMQQVRVCSGHQVSIIPKLTPLRQGLSLFLARLVPQRARGILLSVTQFWSACSQAKIFRGVRIQTEVLMLRSKHSNPLSHLHMPKGVYFINSKISIKSWYNEAAEMAQWFRAVTAFPEDMRSDSQHPMAAHNIYNISYRGYDTFWLRPGSHTVHRHTCSQNTHAHKMTVFKKLICLMVKKQKIGFKRQKQEMRQVGKFSMVIELNTKG